MPVNTAPILATPFPDQILPGGVSSSIIVPVSTFFDPDPNDQLAYTAVQFFGSALPAWLAFDPITLSFTATPDINVSGWTGILLTATDLLGAQATDFFFITVIPPDLTINGTADADLLQGGAGNDQLFGLGGDDALYGNAGNDFLDGGTGADAMQGGIGNDTYVVDDIGDVIFENLYEGIDTVFSSVSYTLPANVENLTLTGADPINGTGNALNNVLTGNTADNVLDGGAGTDTMIGGFGNDTYIVDNPGDVVVENANEGSDTAQSSVTYTLAANVENLVLIGTGSIDGTGNTQGNVLTGNSANNTLDGGAGADTLLGGTGNGFCGGETTRSGRADQRAVCDVCRRNPVAES